MEERENGATREEQNEQRGGPKVGRGGEGAEGQQRGRRERGSRPREELTTANQDKESSKTRPVLRRSTMESVIKLVPTKMRGGAQPNQHRERRARTRLRLVALQAVLSLVLRDANMRSALHLLIPENIESLEVAQAPRRWDRRAVSAFEVNIEWDARRSPPDLTSRCESGQEGFKAMKVRNNMVVKHKKKVALIARDAVQKQRVMRSGTCRTLPARVGVGWAWIELQGGSASFMGIVKHELE
ncbi:hypothetical protein K438DRAFT_1779340 [Mycena galopus ATCC 62051]|nr:hypothetical protein K438DRAFT_1779340 [Mycena galopus ATCC 62051]